LQLPNPVLFRRYLKTTKRSQLSIWRCDDHAPLNRSQSPQRAPRHWTYYLTTASISLGLCGIVRRQHGDGGICCAQVLQATIERLRLVGYRPTHAQEKGECRQTPGPAAWPPPAPDDLEILWQIYVWMTWPQYETRSVDLFGPQTMREPRATDDQARHARTSE
jgi:hypothetical protein